MNTMTYPEARDLIIEAYFKDEIKPYKARFCICGTLCGSCYWNSETYSMGELRRIEGALLLNLRKLTFGIDEKEILMLPDMEDGSILVYYEPLQHLDLSDEIPYHPNYENALFESMSAALDELKLIHEEKGEIIDPSPTFKQRQLKQLICQ